MMPYYITNIGDRTLVAKLVNNQWQELARCDRTVLPAPRDPRDGLVRDLPPPIKDGLK